MSVAHSGSAGGWVFLLCWGLFATPLGGLLATNYRDFANRFEREADASSAWMRRVPPWRFLPERKPGSMVPFMRVLGGVFALFGLLALVLGSWLTLRGQGGLLARTHRPVGPIAWIYPAMAALSLFQFSRPRGLLRLAWSRGYHAEAIGVTLGTLAFPAGYDLGFPTLAAIGLVGGALSGLPLYLRRERSA